MIRYIGRRLLLVVPTIFVPLVLVFLLLRLAPGDPAAQILGDQATPDQVAALRHEMGLDEPLVVQFVLWLKGILTLHLGSSFFFKRPVVEVLVVGGYVGAGWAELHAATGDRISGGRNEHGDAEAKEAGTSRDPLSCPRLV
jgi:ABC-type microcin C transport system permease subunit YejB